MKKYLPNRKQVSRWIRRFIKFSFWFAMGFLLLLIGAVLFVRIQYPEPKILRLISDQVHSSTGMPLRINDISWQLPLRLIVTDVELDYPESDSDRPLSPVISLDRFSVSFRLLPLLKRRFQVQSVILDQPKVYLTPDALAPISSVSSPDSAQTLSSVSSATSSAILPFSLGLSRLDLNDFDCTVILPDSLNQKSFHLTGLNLNIQNLNVPRDAIHSLDQARVQLRIFTHQSEFRYRENEFDMSPSPDIDFSAAWGKDQRWTAAGRLGLAFSENPSHSIHVGMDLKGQGLGDSIRIQDVRLETGTIPVFTVQGGVSDLVGQPEFHGKIISQAVNIQKLYTLLQSFLPPVLLKPLESLEVNGDFRPPAGTFHGSLDMLEFELHTSLQNGYASYQNTVCDSLFYELDLEGTVRAGDGKEQVPNFSRGFMQGRAGFSDVRSALNDSTDMQAGPFFLEFASRMDSSGLPVDGFLRGQLDRLLDGDLGIHFQWGLKKNAPRTPEAVFVNGSIIADSLDISAFPLLSDAFAGKAVFKAELNMPNLYQATVHLGMDIPAFSYSLENLSGTLPPLQFQSELAIQTEPDFQQVWLDSGLIALNELFHGQFSGQMDVQEKRFRLELNPLILNHHSVKAYLPSSVLENMADMHFGGNTGLRLTLDGSLEQPDSVQIQSALSIENGTVHLALQDIKALGLHGHISAEGTSRYLKGGGGFILDSLDLGTRRNHILNTTEVTLNWQWKDQKFICLDDAVFRNEDLNFEARLKGEINDLGSEPIAHVLGEMTFDHEEWVEIVNEMKMRGKVRAQLQLNQEDSPSMMAFSGEMIFSRLNLDQGDLFSIHGFHGRMPFHVEMDLEQGIMLSDSLYSPPSWIDYESRRSQFRSLNPDQGVLFAKNINISGYQMTDLAMDIDVRKGYVQIPWFMVNLFEGNVGGNFHLFLGNGRPEQMAYEIHAHAARVNAAVLGNIPIKKKQEAELDATMAFQGLGVDIQKEMEMDGYFYITQIGPQFASLLLQGMDPNGEDRNIRLTRRLLDMGWKPKLFSFEMRHGYVYPSLSLSQPWFSPLRLPETLSFGRLPLEFFLENPELAQAK